MFERPIAATRIACCGYFEFSAAQDFPPKRAVSL